MAEDKTEPMGLGTMIVSLIIVGFLCAGPGWYLWIGGTKIIGGILLGITGIVVLATIGLGPFWRAFVAYFFGLISTRVSFAILTAIFGTP